MSPAGPAGLGLGQLRDISGYLVVRRNGALKTLAGLDGLRSVGEIAIWHNDALVHLAGLGPRSARAWDTLRAGTVSIKSNLALRSLEGLHRIDNLDGSHGSGGCCMHGTALYVAENPSLLSLAGLRGLRSLNEWSFIGGNGALVSLEGLGSLTSIGRGLKVMNNARLVTLAGESALSEAQAAEQAVECEGLPEGGDRGPGLRWCRTRVVGGLNSLEEVNGTLTIEENSALESLDGLGSLRRINGGLMVRRNAALSSIAGWGGWWPGLLQLQGFADFSDNPQVTCEQVEQFCTSLADPPNPSSGTRWLCGARDCDVWIADWNTGVGPDGVFRATLARGAMNWIGNRESRCAHHAEFYYPFCDYRAN